MKKIIITFILLFYISYGYSQDKVTTLRKGKTYNQKILKGEKNKYKINLNKGEFCIMVVMQMGVDVAVDLLEPSFKKIKTFDSPNGNNGPEYIEFTADSDGLYYLEIYPLNDYSGMTEAQKNQYIEQNQGDYEIGSISVLSKEEYNKKLADEKLKKEKFINALNLGFEKTTINKKLPDNWFVGGKDYNISIDTITKHSGRNSVLISSSEKSDPNSFGGVGNQIPTVFEGQQIELRAYMKLKDVKDGPIGLWLRLDGVSETLQFDNMEQKNIQGTSNWALYSVKLPYPEETRAINFGAFLSGTGQLWVDDFQVLIDGKDISEVKYIEPKKYKADSDKEFDTGSKISSIDLTEFNINNLDILGKVWGFLKYYHPAIAKGEYNWDYELFRILPKILESKNKEERNIVLSQWIDNLGRVQSGKIEAGVSGEVKLKPDLVWINDSTLGGKLTAQLINIRDAERTDTNYYIGLFPGVKNPHFRNENPYVVMKYPDAGFRLLSLYRYWNIIQYYFPYKNLIDENWNDVLKEFIPKFVNASDELEYKFTALALIVRVHDTHAGVWEDNDVTLREHNGLYYAPVRISFIEDKAVVVDYYNDSLGEKSNLQKGDIIETINGKSIDEIIKEKLPITYGSNYPTQLRVIAFDLLRSTDSTKTITFKRGSLSISSQIECFPFDRINLRRYYQKDTCFKLISPEISYIFPGTIKNQYLPQIMQEVMKTKGLIIDLRCYPSEFIVFTLSEYLHSDFANFVKFSTGSIKTPGLFTMSENLKVGQKNENFYKGKVVIIVNQETQSQAEYTSMAFRSVPGAVVIGSTTAGADGNVSMFSLPGAVQTMISGIGVYYPDGKETQRVGIVPDIEVKPTIKGISEGRDELLERAIEIINEK